MQDIDDSELLARCEWPSSSRPRLGKSVSLSATGPHRLVSAVIGWAARWRIAGSGYATCCCCCSATAVLMNSAMPERVG